MRTRKKFTLMPVITLGALSLMVSLPMLSATHLHAASAQRFDKVTVRSGDTLWSLAAAHTPGSADVQETIDRIVEANHLGTSTLQPGRILRIPG